MKPTKLFALLAGLALLASLAACGGNAGGASGEASNAGEAPSSAAQTQAQDTDGEEGTETETDSDEGDAVEEEDAYTNEGLGLTASHTVEITIQDYGTITAELYEEAAPLTVANFVALAGDGFYDGLTFHRIIEGFMIQGGDPNGDGTGGSEEFITGEFLANGVLNPMVHTRGVLSMARGQEADTARSQFFIMHQDAPHLDGQYAAFGMVTDGMEIVDAICADAVVGGNGAVQPGNQPVIESIRVLD